MLIKNYPKKRPNQRIADYNYINLAKREEMERIQRELEAIAEQAREIAKDYAERSRGIPRDPARGG